MGKGTYLFAALWLLSRYVSLGSICGAASMPLTSLLFLDLKWYHIVLCFLIAGLIIYCHRGNIQRLLNGTENKFKWHVNPIGEDDDKKGQVNG